MKLTQLGNSIAQLRWNKHMTVADLAAETELDCEYIAAVEAGKVDIDLLTLHLICAALDIDVSALLDASAKSVDSFEELGALFATPMPQTPPEFLAARRWYQLRKRRMQWLRLKRKQAHVKRCTDLEAMRVNREAILDELERARRGFA